MDGTRVVAETRKEVRLKAAIIKEPGVVKMGDVPEIGSLSEYQCLCRNIYGASCSGTDRKLIHNKTPWPNEYPAVLGHENVAEVIEVGAKVRNFAVGDAVLRPVYVYAGEERNGLHAAFGGFSELGVITDSKAMKSDGLTEFNPYANFQVKIPTAWKHDQSAVMFITLKETFSWLQKLTPLYGKRVGVIGAGAVGLFYTRLASVFCAKEVTTLDIKPDRFDRARKVGADRCVDLGAGEKPEQPFDLLIDAAGILSKIGDFIPFVAIGGTFAVYGLDHTFTATFEGMGSGITFAFHNSDEANPLVHDTCVALVDKGMVDLSDFHSSVVPFDEVPQAYERIDAGKELKVVFTF